MIQDIGFLYNNSYKPREPQQNDYCMFVQGRKVLVMKDCDTLRYLTFGEIAQFCSKEALTYLFSIEAQAFYLADAKLLPESIFTKYAFENHNIFRTRKPKELAFAGVTACQLANWYHNTRFCGACGHSLQHDEKERMMRCPSCGNMHFPKISPAVIVAVKNKDKLLVTKYADRDYKKYALIAGFAEIGETIEETVKREVMEEVGIKVTNIRYYKSQPWSFSDTLLFGFVCDVDGSDEITLDHDELAVGEWVTREEIRMEFDDISLTNEMITQFIAGRL